jgi:hypothetical protein
MDSYTDQGPTDSQLQDWAEHNAHADGLVDDQDGQECKRCRDLVAYLSTDGLCDGCVAEDSERVSVSLTDLAKSLAAMRLARPGWSYEDTAKDLLVVLQGGESCEPVTDEETSGAAAEALVDKTRLIRMQARNGKVELDLAVAREISALWVQTARTMLQDAPNYSETSMEFPDREAGVRYAFTVQRVGKLTPHEARKAAEARADKAEGALADMVRRLEEVARPDGSWPGADAAEIVRDVLQKVGYLV